MTNCIQPRLNVDTKYIYWGVGILLFFGMSYGGAKMIQLSADSKKNRDLLLPTVTATEQKYGIPSGMLDRLLTQESHYRSDIINGTKKSSVGALGIAQFMPATAKELLGSTNAALQPKTAIEGAGKYLAALYRQCGNNWTLAVASYNWGVGNVLKKGIANAPKETRDYIAAIV